MQKPRNNRWLLVGVSLLCALGWVVNATAPDSGYTIIALFILIASAIYTIGLFITNHSRRALLLSAAVTVFFLLRYMNLRHPLYIILLLASLLSLELTSQKR